MPAERTPAPAGHSSVVVVARSVSKVNSATGTDGSSSVFQSTRHHVSVSVSPIGGAEDVGAVAGRGAVGVDIRAARRRPAARQAEPDAVGTMVVVEEVGPEQGAVGEAAGAAGAREFLAERPAGRCGKFGLGPQRRGGHSFGHSVYDEQLRRRCGRVRSDAVQHRVGDAAPDAKGQERKVDQ